MAMHFFLILRSFHTTFANFEPRVNRANDPKRTKDWNFAAVYEKALNFVREHIQTHVIRQNKVLRLTSLLYIEELKRNGYENENYRSEKLLKRLQNDSNKEHVSFLKVDHDKLDAVSFWLVYSSNISFNNALAQAYTFGSNDKYQNAALLLHSSILQAYQDSKSLSMATNIRWHGP